MLHRRLGPLACVFAALVAAAPAHASAPVALDWSAPAGCPSGDEVLSEVSRLLGPRPETNEPVLRVTAQVRRKDEGPFVVRLEIPSPEGPRFREVSAVSCVSLGQATALILALMIDPEAALAEPPPPAPPAVPPAVSPPLESTPRQTQIPPSPSPANSTALAPIIFVPLGRLPPLTAPQITPKPRPIRRPDFSFGAQFAMDFGSLPSASYGPSANIGLLFPSWHLALSGAYFTEQKSLLKTPPLAGSSVNFFAIQGGLGIPVELRERLEFVPRIRLEIGRFGASSYGVSQPGQGSAVSVGANVGGTISLKIIQKFRLVAGFDFVLYLTRPQFVVTGVGEVHKPSAFVGRLSLGGELRF